MHYCSYARIPICDAHIDPNCTGHFKMECGTEARLVQQNLRAIIEKEPIEGAKPDIFLDSGKGCQYRSVPHTPFSQ